MQIVYATEEFPESFSSCIFLVGPTPRSDDAHSWRNQALALIEATGFDGVVAVPEPRGLWHKEYDMQIDWETLGLTLADVILCWVPRELQHMPAFTTNVEYGMWVASHKLVFGAPPEAPKNRYLTATAARFGVPCFDDLESLVDCCVARVTPGATRSGAERFVPLHMWRQPAFQRWLKASYEAGHQLTGFESLYELIIPQVHSTPSEETDTSDPSSSFSPLPPPFVSVFKPSVQVAGENRVKSNEIVVVRPDISVILAHSTLPEPTGTSGRSLTDLSDVSLVVIEEFRSPTLGGMLLEFPGGSSPDESSKEETAVSEFFEETGLSVDSSRMKYLGCHQLAPTLSPFSAHLFDLELSETELDEIRAIDKRFDEASTELCYPRVVPVSELLQSVVTSNHEASSPRQLDWSSLGMLFGVLLATV